MRKPNGEEYAADSIYYLCLGVQQYLYENGRVDNIFTDYYYDKFTTILNELLRNYSPRLNSQGLDDYDDDDNDDEKLKQDSILYSQGFLHILFFISNHISFV